MGLISSIKNMINKQKEKKEQERITFEEILKKEQEEKYDKAIWHELVESAGIMKYLRSAIPAEGAKLDFPYSDLRIMTQYGYRHVLMGRDQIKKYQDKGEEIHYTAHGSPYILKPSKKYVNYQIVDLKTGKELASALHIDSDAVDVVYETDPTRVIYDLISDFKMTPNKEYIDKFKEDKRVMEAFAGSLNLPKAYEALEHSRTSCLPLETPLYFPLSLKTHKGFASIVNNAGTEYEEEIIDESAFRYKQPGEDLERELLNIKSIIKNKRLINEIKNVKNWEEVLVELGNKNNEKYDKIILTRQAESRISLGKAEPGDEEFLMRNK